jgi:WD40 repeat protein
VPLTTPEPRLVAQTFDTINGLMCSADGRLVTGAGYGRATLWSAEGNELGTIEQSGVCWYGALSSRGLLAAGFGDCTLWTLNTAKKSSPKQLAQLHGIVASLAWSSDGKLLFTGNCGDHTVRLWSADGELLASGKTKKSGAWFVALTPDGKVGFSGAGDKLVHVWDAATCKEIDALVGHSGKILGLAVSGDGKRLGSASQDRTARVWDVESRQPVIELIGHKKQVTSITFAADGKRVATASSDRTVRIWNSRSGEPLQTLRLDNVQPMSVAWGSELYVAWADEILAFAI